MLWIYEFQRCKVYLKISNHIHYAQNWEVKPKRRLAVLYHALCSSYRVPCLALNSWLKTREQRDYNHALRKPVYCSSFPLFCPNRGLKISWDDHCCLVVWAFSIAKILFRNGSKILFRIVPRRGQRSVLAPLVTFVCFWSLHVLLR
jgi:hypothetical protein